MAFLSGVPLVVSILVATIGITYSFAHYLLGPVEETLTQCNRNMQAFDLQEIPVYWRVFEAPCRGNDVNFDIVRVQIERMLNQLTETDQTWPEAECGYAQTGSIGTGGYVWGYGTDYDAVETNDCLEPLRELQKEKEENANLGDYLKDSWQQQPAQWGNILANFF